MGNLIIMLNKIINKASPSSKPYVKIFALIIFLKLILMAIFSSDYQNRLFIPFIEHFLSNLDNPWQYFYQIQVDKFPYPPLMLYILSLFYLPYHLLFENNIILQNIFFKLPTLISDILIVYVFMMMFPRNVREILLFYFVSPIILYGAYIHSQLDLIPMAFLILSIYFLSLNKLLVSAVIFGLALSIKFHVIIALPLIIIYIFKNYKKINVLYFIFIPTAIYFFMALPYLFSQGYFYMVLINPKQMTIFDTIYNIGNLKIYVPIFACIGVYTRFLAYRKVNNDLFYTFLGILFSLFVLLIFPAPAWYIWMVPFISIFFIVYYMKHLKILYLYLVLSMLYLVYFIFFHVGDYRDLTFLMTPLNIKITNERLMNIIYTSLEVTLCATLYSLYKFGVKSNSVYKKVHNLIIGIGGDSAAGKNTLLSDIKLLLAQRLLELEGDADHKWQRGDENWDRLTHLNPKANYLHKQANDVFALKYGRSILRSDYDHNTGRFMAEKQIKPKEFIILTGLHPFYLPISRKIIDFKIYLDTEEKLRRHWKIIRDTQQRGYPKEKVLEQIEERMDDAKKYIHPQKEFADLIISYFTDDVMDRKFEIGNEKCASDLKLKLILDSSIHLEGLFKKLMEEKVDIYWDYADNLNKQYLILSSPPKKETIINIAKDIIPNIEEIVASKAIWLDGYRGFAQLIVLLVLSEKMREEGGYND